MPTLIVPRRLCEAYIEDMGDGHPEGRYRAVVNRNLQTEVQAVWTSSYDTVEECMEQIRIECGDGLYYPDWPNQ